MPTTTDIATYLESNGFGYTNGTNRNIFENEMPGVPDDCVSIFVYGGRPPPLVWEGEFPAIQVRVRAKTHENAYSKAYSIWKALHKLTNQTVNSHLYHYIEATASPASLGRDQKGRHLYVVNLIATKEVE